MTGSLYFSLFENISNIFEDMPEYLVEYVEENEALYFNHNYGLNVSTYFNSFLLWDNLYMVATSEDANGNDFLAIFEHKYYPFYGV